MAQNVPNRRQKTSWTTIAVCLGLLFVFVLLDRLGGRGDVRPTPKTTPAAESSRQTAEREPVTTRENDDENDSLVIHNVRVLNEDRRVVYQGDVDLRPTLNRIEQGERLRFSHDGIVFENRERRLPQKPRGHYHEYVQPTPGEDGPGAQRVVTGQDGEVYYTHDHYRTFHKVR